MSAASPRSGDWKKIRLKILARDGYICGYCGSEATQVDHVVPVSKGGSNDEHNLIASCSRCNRLKSDKTLKRTQWINKKYAQYLGGISNTPHQQPPQKET